MDDSKTLTLIIACGILFLMALGSCNNSSSRTDGIFESATEKMDRGEALNKQESQRIYDIINWEESKKKYNIK